MAQKTEQVQRKCTAEGEEVVSVPAGKFQTLRIICVNSRDDATVGTFWYAPSVRQIAKAEFGHWTRAAALPQVAPFRHRRVTARRPRRLTPRRKWWAEQGSNLRPQPCKGCALPAELSARAWILANLHAPVNHELPRCLTIGPAPYSRAYMNRPRYTILVIDDDPLILEMVTELLEVGGHRVLSASSGEDGLTRARADHPDLVLLDYHMPGMDGLAVVLRLDHARRSRAERRSRVGTPSASQPRSA